VATELDLLRYLSAHAEKENERIEVQFERQLRHRNVLDFLIFFAEGWNHQRSHYESPRRDANR
jgi:hypothetical protein